MSEQDTKDLGIMCRAFLNAKAECDRLTDTIGTIEKDLAERYDELVSAEREIERLDRRVEELETENADLLEKCKCTCEDDDPPVDTCELPEDCGYDADDEHEDITDRGEEDDKVEEVK